MSKLGPEAQALIAAGRGALRPTEADRQRVLEALRARIAAGELPGPAPSPAAGSSAATWPLLSGVLAGAALLGGLAFYFASSAPQPAAPAPSVAASSAAVPIATAIEPAPLPPPAPELPSASNVAPLRPSAENRSAPSRPATSSLAEEVALLSRAETELHAHRFGSALRLLNEYERRFPRGVLVQEDVAAKVQALCGLGRVAEAQVELARLAPGSPHASRARAACRLK